MSLLMSCFVDRFSGEARIKKPTAKTPPRQGEARTIEISALEFDVDVHSHSTDFLGSFSYYKKAKFDTIKKVFTLLPHVS